MKVLIRYDSIWYDDDTVISGEAGRLGGWEALNLEPGTLEPWNLETL